jgi:hypothetical protein
MARRRVRHEAELGDLSGPEIDWDEDQSSPSQGIDPDLERRYQAARVRLGGDEPSTATKLFNKAFGIGDKSMARKGNRGGGLRAWQEAHGIDTSGWDHPKRKKARKGKKGRKSGGRVEFVTADGQHVSFGTGAKKRKGGKKRRVSSSTPLWEQMGWRKPGRKKHRKGRKAGRKAARRTVQSNKPLWKQMGWRKPGRKRHGKHRKGAKRVVRRGAALWEQMGWRKPGRKKHHKGRKIGRKAARRIVQSNKPLWKQMGWKKPGRKKHHKVGRKAGRKSGAYIIFKGQKFYA